MSSQQESSKQYIQDNNIHVILKNAIKELCSARPDRPYAFLRDYFGKLDADEGAIYEYENHTQNQEEAEVVSIPRDNRASIHRRGAISAEVYTDDEVKNYTRKVRKFQEKNKFLMRIENEAHPLKISPLLAENTESDA